MSVVLVGMSYRCAPITLLEKIAISDDDYAAISADLLAEDFISEALIISTCNRTEIYVVSDGFHPTVEHVIDILSRHSKTAVADLVPYLYVRHAEAAAEHLLRVAAGLDSMVIGEQQIIGQIRSSYQQASQLHTLGRGLHELARTALHTGKRVHTETTIDAAGPSMVSFAVETALQSMCRADLVGLHALIIGAGAMSSLAATHLGKLGATLTIANRTKERACTVADHAKEAGVPAKGTDLTDLAGKIAKADIVVTATGSIGPLISAELFERHAAAAGSKEVEVGESDSAVAGLEVADSAQAENPETSAASTQLENSADSRALADSAQAENVGTSETSALSQTPDLVICDLSLPRDVDAESIEALRVPGPAGYRSVTVFNIESLQARRRELDAMPSDQPTTRAKAIVAEELTAYVARERSQDAIPTIKALRQHAAEVLEGELTRFDARTPELDAKSRDEAHRAMKRVVDKLMHTPTVHLKKMAGQTDISYSEAVRTLFGLPAGMVPGLYSPADDAPQSADGAQDLLNIADRAGNAAVTADTTSHTDGAAALTGMNAQSSSGNPADNPTDRAQNTTNPTDTTADSTKAGQQ